jgi:hypothetical protein
MRPIESVIYQNVVICCNGANRSIFGSFWSDLVPFFYERSVDGLSIRLLLLSRSGARGYQARGAADLRTRSEKRVLSPFGPDWCELVPAEFGPGEKVFPAGLKTFVCGRVSVYIDVRVFKWSVPRVVTLGE